MLDQAARLRRLAKNENIMDTRIITITSGKGGVGKSNFVVNLGIKLQKMGKNVLILDADVGMGNDDVLMGFLPKYNIYDIILNDKAVEEVLIEGPYGVKLLPAGTGLNNIEDIDEIKRQNFLNKLDNLREFDFILMDTGAGINKNVLDFVQCSEEVIIVTTPEPTSLTDAYSLMKVINHFKLKDTAKVIVNKVLNYEEGCKTFNKFNNAAKKFLKIELDHLGNISEDRKLVEAVRSQVPVIIQSPNSRAALDIEEIALKLCGYRIKTQSYGLKGIFKKMFNMFS